jgi:anti-anti-sigma regulatory factor
MAIACEQLDGAARLRIEGVLDISVAEELKAALLGTLPTPVVRIDLSAVTYLDVTAIQLLWAARRESTGTSLIFEPQVPEPVRIALQDAGFQDMLMLINEPSPLNASAGEMS